MLQLQPCTMGSKPGLGNPGGWGLETDPQAASLTSPVSWAALWLSAFWGAQVGEN